MNRPNADADVSAYREVLHLTDRLRKPCPNCADGCTASRLCDGCDEILCEGCWACHNGDCDPCPHDK